MLHIISSHIKKGILHAGFIRHRQRFASAQCHCLLKSFDSERSSDCKLANSVMSKNAIGDGKIALENTNRRARNAAGLSISPHSEDFHEKRICQCSDCLLSSPWRHRSKPKPRKIFSHRQLREGFVL